MKKEQRYYHFKTASGEEVMIRSNDFFEAQQRACRDYHIIEYLGWTKTLDDFDNCMFLDEARKETRR